MKILIFLIIFLILFLLVFLIISLKNQNKSSILKNINKKEDKKQSKKSHVSDELEESFCKAGMFQESEREWYFKMQKRYPIICFFIGLSIGIYIGGIWLFLWMIFGVYIGVKIPNMKLNHAIKTQIEEVEYFLPIVLELLVIGVSSGLDVGPSIDKIVSSVKERGMENAVILLLEKVQSQVKSGSSFEEALQIIGQKSHQIVLKQAFMQISQVSKHGGAIVDQLKNLADTVKTEYEVKIDTIIKKLELKATAPLGLVFAGNMAVLLGGIFMNIAQAMK